MSDQTTNQPEEGADSRVEYLDSGGSNVARTLVAILFVIVFAVLAVVLLAPGAIQDMLTSGSSESEDMQETVTADPNIDTGFPRRGPDRDGAGRDGRSLPRSG